MKAFWFLLLIPLGLFLYGKRKKPITRNLLNTNQQSTNRQLRSVRFSASGATKKTSPKVAAPVSKGYFQNYLGQTSPTYLPGYVYRNRQSGAAILRPSTAGISTSKPAAGIKGGLDASNQVGNTNTNALYQQQQQNLAAQRLMDSYIQFNANNINNLYSPEEQVWGDSLVGVDPSQMAGGVKYYLT